MSEPVRIAQVMGKMNSGGVEAVVTNYYRAIDKSRVQFDFFVDADSEFPQRAELEALGAGIYVVPPYQQLGSYIKELERIFRRNRYTVVHAHINTLCVFPLYAAWRAGVPVRIVHNHSTAHIGEGKKTLFKYLLRPFARVFATDYFACSELAGRWLYGNRCFDSGRVFVLNNAFDTHRFAFSADARARLRSELGLAPDTFVVGHVGRFTYAKNHAFLIDIFTRLHEKDPHSVLVLIGEGELEADIRQKAAPLGDAVRFLGVQPQANLYYSAMDVFCLPSFYEGLSLVGVEAQANGLPCVFSAGVTKEIDLTGRVRFLDLALGAEEWAAQVRDIAALRRTDASPELAGFSVQQECRKLEAMYLDFENRKGRGACRN